MLRERLQLRDLVLHSAVVGHLELLPGQWCVLVKEPFQQEVRGVILVEEAYQSFSFDPFVVGAKVLTSDVLRVLLASLDDPTGDADVATSELGTAYARFLALDLDERHASYSSHPGLFREPQTSGSIDVSQAESDWADLELTSPETLQHESEIIAEEGSPDPASSQPSVTHLVERLTLLEDRLRRRTRALMIAICIAVLLGLGVSAFAWIRFTDEVRQLDQAKVDLTTLNHGLRLTSQDIDPEEALIAKLRDLSTISLQSGAWQAGLQARGVDLEHLLDLLVLLYTEQDSLQVVLDNEPDIAEIARQRAALDDLATRQPQLAQLSDVTPAMMSLAEVAEPLQILAGHASPLAQLAAHQTSLVELAPHAQRLATAEPEISRLVEHRQAVLALAARENELLSLLENARALNTVASEVARVLTFMEQRQADLEQLAKHRQALLALVSYQADLTSLAGNRSSLSALAAEQSKLLALANDVHLARFVNDDKHLAVISDNLDVLALLSLHGGQLLRDAGITVPAP